MGDLKLNGATSGTITLTPTAVAGTNTITLPASTGTMALTASPTFTGTVTATTITSPASTALTVQSAGTTAMTINTSQNVGIGTTSPSFRVTANYTAPSTFTNASGDFIQMWQNGGTNALGVAIETTAAVARFVNNNGYITAFNYAGTAEAMRIDASGNLMVNTTSAIGSKLRVVNTAGSVTSYFETVDTSDVIFVKANSAGGTGSGLYVMPVRIGSSATFKGGVYYNGGTGLMEYVGTSDYRIKEDVIDAPNQLSILNNIKVREFLVSGAAQRVVGFVAHELAEQVPTAVTGEKDAVDGDGNPIYQTVNPQALVPLLIKAVQELSAKNDALEARLAALEAK